MNPKLRFGLEGEYLLVDRATYQPLWHHDLSFRKLNALLEAIPYEGVLGGLSLEGLELDPPHRRIMPWYVEGYGVPGRAMAPWVDLLPKGLEIRTPVCSSLARCLEVYEVLHEALQRALGNEGYRAVPLAHHPLAWEFDGPQNHPRVDWWRWGMQAMTTYGPDLNVSLPADHSDGLDWERLQRRVNFYAPAIVAFSLAAPVARGKLWQVEGETGLSARTYRRSLHAPAVAYHPKEQGRLEFKAFDMPADRRDFEWMFLLWLWLVLDDETPARADDAQRVKDLQAAARVGWEAPGLVERAEEALDRAAGVLANIDQDPAPLAALRGRLDRRATPAHTLIRRMQEDGSVPRLMRFIEGLGEQTRGVTPQERSEVSHGSFTADALAAR